MRRIPKNYDGNLPTGRQLSELLPEILGDISKKFNDEPYLILAAWDDIVGERIRKMTRATKFDRGVLEVKVKNSTLLSLLIEHEKARLLAAFRKRFPKIKFEDILFKIG